jgi:hypothetical protein
LDLGVGPAERGRCGVAQPVKMQILEAEAVEVRAGGGGNTSAESVFGLVRLLGPLGNPFRGVSFLGTAGTAAIPLKGWRSRSPP